jgi:hypothetical protein
MKEGNNVSHDNLEKMLAEGPDMPNGDFPNRLAEAVLAEVRREHHRRVGRMWLRRVSAAAAVVVVVASVAILRRGGPQPLGWIQDVQGVVLLGGPGPGRPAAVSAPVHARQTIRTLSGSKATIRLADQSRLRLAPRTALQLDRKSHGAEVLLEKGALSLQVERQPSEQYLSVRTPTARLRILGTELDVRLATKPDGVQRTTVNVRSGAVELGSGDQRALLLPGTVGIADQGSPPLRRAACLEVNLLNDLMDKTETLARQSASEPGPPTIIDLVGAAVWVVVPLDRFEAVGNRCFSAELSLSAFGVRAYTLEGVAIETTSQGRTLRLDLSGRPSSVPPVERVVLAIPGVAGLFHIEEDGSHSFIKNADESNTLTLYQFHVTSSMTVQTVHGEIVDTDERFGRTIVTVAAHSQTLQIVQ